MRATGFARSVAGEDLARAPAPFLAAGNLRADDLRAAFGVFVADFCVPADLRAADFFEMAFFPADFLLAVFFDANFLAEDFLTDVFFAARFLAAVTFVLLAADFFAALDFFPAVFLPAFFAGLRFATMISLPPCPLPRAS